MAYRTHGDEFDPGAPSPYTPYTPGTENFFLSPPVSPSRTRESSYTSSSRPARARVDSISSAESESASRYLFDRPSRFTESLHRRTSTGVARTEEMLRQWSTGVHWYVPTSMVVVFLCGCLGAVGHHLFYSRLDGRPAVDQLMMVRYGTAFAFFTKATLVGAVVLSYRQRVWHTLRDKPISIRGLDALFSIVEDPSWFVMAPEIFTKARVATAMALATWLIPLASVLSPGSLTAQLKRVDHPGNCTVRSLNFSQEADSDWLRPRHATGYNLAFFNTTPPPPAKSIADWYDQPSFHARRIAQLGINTGQIIAEKESPCPKYNCTYETTFYGPWYNCSEVAFADSRLNISEFVPAAEPLSLNPNEGGKNYIYQAVVEEDDWKYKRPQAGYNDTEYDEQGVFRRDPDVWLGWVVNSTKQLDNLPENPRWKFKMEPFAYRCRHEKAHYRVTSVWTGTSLVSRNATISDSKPLLRKGERIGPKTDSMERYKEFVAYYALGQLVRNTIVGDLVQGNWTSNIVTHTEASVTRLINQTATYPAHGYEFAQAFQRFYQDIVMSFITEPLMEIATTDVVACNRTSWENQFKYIRTSLWVGYAIAIAASFCSIVVGSLSIHHNGMCSDTTFSKILVTTRNKTLDQLVKKYPGVALGGDPLPKSLEQTQLRFGVVKTTNAYGDDEPLIMKHTAFGLESEVIRINKRDVRRSIVAQNEVELGSRGPFFPGAGLGVLPG